MQYELAYKNSTRNSTRQTHTYEIANEEKIDLSSYIHYLPSITNYISDNREHKKYKEKPWEKENQ